MKEILKKHCNPNYITVSTYHLMDKSLSLKAKGLLTILLSLPQDWNYSVDTLAELSSDGRTATRTCLQELEKHNYLTRKKIYIKNRIAGVEYHVYETPEDTPDQENTLKYDFLTLENLTLENKHNPNNTTNNIDSIKEPIKDIKNNKVYTGNRKKKELFKSTDVAEEIIKYYQTNCSDLKQIRVITDSRKKAVKDILKKYGKDTVQEVLDKAQNSSFLTGKTGTWTADFDWIFKEKNFVKILEGNYDSDFTKTSRHKKDVFGELNGKVQSIKTNKKQPEDYLEKLRKEGRRIEY